MTPRNPILAATDLSAPARHAVDRAFRVAADTGADLELMHVINQGAVNALRRLLGVRAGEVETRILDRARDGLYKLAVDLGQARGVAAGIHLATGGVLSAILERAEARDAGLLVLGAHGEDYLGHLLLGTTAERLLRRTPRPVLMVRQTPHESYRRVLVPVDFSAWSVPAVRLARALAPRAELVLLHAFEAPFESKLRFAGVDEVDIDRYRATTSQEALAELRATAEQAGLGPEDALLGVHHGGAARVILTQEQEQDCDLIVMGKHGQGMLEELLLGSVTKHVLSEATCDVLVASAPPPVFRPSSGVTGTEP
jgi:nucleotide-binding universal stress UspA family protein